jgi:hypothetical protein
MRWRMRRVERQATRMHEMTDRLNVDGAALARACQGELYAEARARCIACEISDNSEPTATDVPTFCANPQLFEQYRKR